MMEREKGEGQRREERDVGEREREKERQMERKSEISVEWDVGGRNRCEFFLALGYVICQVLVI